MCPFCYPCPIYLFKIPFLLYQRPDLSSMPEDFVTRAQSISVSDIVTSLSKTPNVLDYGFCGAITGNIVFLGFFLICCVTFKAESRRLKGYATKDNYENVAYFEKMLKYSLILLAGVAFLAAAAILSSAHDNNLLFFILYSPAMMLIGIMSLSLFSLIEGVILFAVKGLISGENQNFNTLVNHSLRILKPLFLLNILFTVMGYIPSVIRFPFTVSAFLESGSGPSSIMLVLLNLASFFTYFNALATAFIFSAPFILIMHKLNIVDAFKLLFNFIINNFIKYLIFVGTGIFILFLPTFLHIILNTQIHPLSLEYSIVEMVIEVIRICLAVVFYIAMFGFMIDKKNLLNNDVV